MGVGVELASLEEWSGRTLYMRFYREYFVVMVFFLVGLPAARALQWTGTEAVLRPHPDGTMPVASYPFRNATSAPVTITQAVATCDFTIIAPVPEWPRTPRHLCLRRPRPHRKTHS
jgi:hypothetical protein